MSEKEMTSKMPETLDELTKEEIKLLLYFEKRMFEMESRSTVDSVRASNIFYDQRCRIGDGIEPTLERWIKSGFVKYGELHARSTFANYIGHTRTHWVVLSDAAINLAHQARRQSMIRGLNMAGWHTVEDKSGKDFAREIKLS